MPGNYEKHFSVLTELTEDIAKDTRETVLAIDTLVVLAMPVGNPDLWQSPAPPGYVGGRARANWTVSIGFPSDAVFDSVDQGRALDDAKTQAAKINGFVTVYIQNNLPYIVPLNEGWSSQAPSKFIDRIIDKVANANK
jgi:hypothetical protein